MESGTEVGEGVKFPTDGQLVSTYKDIEALAMEAIQEDTVVGNPILERNFVDLDWAISVQALLRGSEASLFIEEEVLPEIGKAEPMTRFIPSGLFHVSLAEVVHRVGEEIGERKFGGRKVANIGTKGVLKRYRALRNNLPDFGPVRLRLYRVIPVLDPKEPSQEGRTATIVAAFLREGDDTIFRVRQAIGPAVKKAGLLPLGGLRVPKVLFATVGRLADPPQIDGKKIPLLAALEAINSRIPKRCMADIAAIDVLSTTPMGYRQPPWVYIDPPIALRKSDRDPSLPLRYRRAPRPFLSAASTTILPHR